MQEIHVPLLIRYKGFAPRICTEAVSLLDLYPTFCELFGLQRPQGLVGTSLAPVLRGGAAPPRTVYCETPDGTGPAAAVVTANFLYSLYADVQFIRPWSIWPFDEALYDIQADPACTKNVVEQQSPIADAMNADLRRLNPRWTHFTREVLRGSDASVELGPNLLADAWNQEKTFPAARTTTGDGANLRVEAPPQEMRFPVTLDAPDQPYVVDVGCRLSSGVVVFELKDVSGDNVYWHYECHKPSPDWKNIRRKLIPKSQNVQLLIRIEKPGVMELAPPSLCRAQVPLVPLLAQKSSRRVAPVQKELTEEEIQRLKTLGYL